MLNDLGGVGGVGDSHDLAVEIGPSGRLRAVLRMVAGASIVLTAALALFVAFGLPLSSLFVYLPIWLTAGLSPLILINLRTTVQVDSNGVRISGGERIMRGDWGWDELLEVGVTRLGGTWTLAVRPRGSAYSQPGPTAPAIVQPPIRDRHTRQQAHRILRSWCRTHEVVFTETADGLGSAPPGSSLRPS